MTFLTAGVADLDSQRRMMADMCYRIGSTTKTFTAVVTLQLISESRLAFDDLVSRWFPELPEPQRSELTVEHLLRMRSGLYDFVDHPSLLELDANLVPHTLEEVLELGLGGQPVFRPGTRYGYCNTNFCVLEAIINHLTGRSLGDEIAERILEPLHMRNTNYPDEDDLSLPAPYIRGHNHDAEDREWRECSEECFGRGDGAMISTALDLARFFRALFEGRLVPEPLLKRMRTVVPDDPPPDRAYGLGLIADTLPCRTVWGHSGGGFGYVHDPFLDPATGRIVITMRNGTYGFRVQSLPPEQQPRFTPTMRCTAYG